MTSSRVHRRETLIYDGRAHQNVARVVRRNSCEGSCFVNLDDPDHEIVVFDDGQHWHGRGFQNSDSLAWELFED